MNAATRENILRRLEQHFADLAEDGVSCDWTPGKARLFEAALNGPYTDDAAQEAIDRMVDYSRSSRSAPRPDQLAGYLQRAGELSYARPAASAKQAARPAPARPKIPRDPVCRMFGWDDPEDDNLTVEERRERRHKALLEGAGDNEFVRAMVEKARKRAHDEQSRSEGEAAA